MSTFVQHSLSRSASPYTASGSAAPPPRALALPAAPSSPPPPVKSATDRQG
jgi:hypothetical protein